MSAFEDACKKAKEISKALTARFQHEHNTEETRKRVVLTTVELLKESYKIAVPSFFIKFNIQVNPADTDKIELIPQNLFTFLLINGIYAIEAGSSTSDKPAKWTHPETGDIYEFFNGVGSVTPKQK